MMKRGYIALVTLIALVPLIAYAGGKSGPAPSSYINGSLNGVSCNVGATGWASDSSAPTQSVTVYFYYSAPTSVSGSGSVGQTVANQYYAPSCGSGSCYHGFTWALPHDNTTHTLYAAAQNVNGASGNRLSNDGQSFMCAYVPTCTVTYSQDPVPYGSGVQVRWSTANAASGCGIAAPG